MRKTIEITKIEKRETYIKKFFFYVSVNQKKKILALVTVFASSRGLHF